MKDLRALLEHQIQDLHSGELQILDALPKMIEAARNPRLKELLESHRKETEAHRERLEAIAEELDCAASGETCKGMEGILEEGSKLVEDEAEEDDVRDAAIVTACQRVEHYEMAGYGSARSYARRLGLEEVSEMLQQTLDEEQSADEKLTRIAESDINREAAD